jgi:ribosomal protein S2
MEYSTGYFGHKEMICNMACAAYITEMAPKIYCINTPKRNKFLENA